MTTSGPHSRSGTAVKVSCTASMISLSSCSTSSSEKIAEAFTYWNPRWCIQENELVSAWSSPHAWTIKYHSKQTKCMTTSFTISSMVFSALPNLIIRLDPRSFSDSLNSSMATRTSSSISSEKPVRSITIISMLKFTYFNHASYTHMVITVPMPLLQPPRNFLSFRIIIIKQHY